MLSRILCATVVCISLASMTLSATAQSVRFDTNVGTFDLVLNPTGNANLQGHVDNMLAYVESGRYDLTVINRAVRGFILQMGGLQANTLSLPTSSSSFSSVDSFDRVIVDSIGNDNQIDFDTTGLTNVRGTVSLALPNFGGLGARPFEPFSDESPLVNYGTGSFFVNLGDNSSNLDPGAISVDDFGADYVSGGFVTFATISDMSTIDLIMDLQQVSDPSGGDNVPVLDNSALVIIERAFVLETVAATVVEQLDDDSSSLVDDPLPLIIEPRASISVVPEPSTLLLASLGLMGLAARRRRKC